MDLRAGVLKQHAVEALHGVGIVGLRLKVYGCFCTVSAKLASEAQREGSKETSTTADPPGLVLGWLRIVHCELALPVRPSACTPAVDLRAGAEVETADVLRD